MAKRGLIDHLAKGTFYVGAIAVLSSALYAKVDDLRDKESRKELTNKVAVEASYNPGTEEVQEREEPNYLERAVEETEPEPIYQSTLREDLRRHEGVEAFAYTDTRGNRTIGAGYNLERGGAREGIEAIGANFDEIYTGRQALTDDQINILLDQDIETARADAIAYLGRQNFERIRPEAQDIVTNMAFNIGRTRLNGFVNLRDALQRQDYSAAADEMQDSRWYNQVGRRSRDLTNQMRALANGN